MATRDFPLPNLASLGYGDKYVVAGDVEGNRFAVAVRLVGANDVPVRDTISFAPVIIAAQVEGTMQDTYGGIVRVSWVGE